MNEHAAAGRRPGRAWLWWTLGVLAAGVLTGLVVPLARLTRTADHSLTDKCRDNVRTLSLACHSYADDNDGAMPPTLEHLFPSYADSTRCLKCRGDKSGATSSYTLVPGLLSDMPGDFILLYEISIGNHGRAWRGPGNHAGGWRQVARLNGCVEWWWSDQGEAEFQKLLAEQAEKVKAWKPPAGLAGQGAAGESGAGP
jgi:hypothetical protein